MRKTTSVRKFWEEFCAENAEVNLDEPYQVWYFDNNRESSKKLVELVLHGKKKATASLVVGNESDAEDGGTIGGYSVVTDFDGNPQCVILTTEINRVPFNEVDAQFAFDEGEGDQTLEVWRRGHRRFFTECCCELNIVFNESMLVDCKRFQLLFPKL